MSFPAGKPSPGTSGIGCLSGALLRSLKAGFEAICHHRRIRGFFKPRSALFSPWTGSGGG